jgi:hypothetical protein
VNTMRPLSHTQISDCYLSQLEGNLPSMAHNSAPHLDLHFPYQTE